MMDKQWTGLAPTHCDVCNYPLYDHFYNAKTQQGPWGILCENCFRFCGVGLGTGKGQKYDVQNLKQIGVSL